MKFQGFILFLFVTALMHVNIQADSLATQKIPYSLKEIQEHLSLGNQKKPHRWFANQCSGCDAFWGYSSADKNVFFFTRKGKVSGEYRIEKFHREKSIDIPKTANRTSPRNGLAEAFDAAAKRPNVKYSYIEEMYISSQARGGDVWKTLEKVPFVRRIETLHYHKDAETESTIQWELLLRDKEGKVLECSQEKTEKNYQTIVTIQIPDELLTEKSDSNLLNKPISPKPTENLPILGLGRIDGSESAGRIVVTALHELSRRNGAGDGSPCIVGRACPIGSASLLSGCGWEDDSCVAIILQNVVGLFTVDSRCAGITAVGGV